MGRRFLSSLIPDIKSHAEAADLKKQEDRWHSVWIKSLEFMMLVGEYNRCPQHSDPKVNAMTASVGCGTDAFPRDTEVQELPSKKTVAEFADWLTGIEKQLEAICNCNAETEETSSVSPECGIAEASDTISAFFPE